MSATATSASTLAARALCHTVGPIPIPTLRHRHALHNQPSHQPTRRVQTNKHAPLPRRTSFDVAAATLPVSPVYPSAPTGRTRNVSTASASRCPSRAAERMSSDAGWPSGLHTPAQWNRKSSLDRYLPPPPTPRARPPPQRGDADISPTRRAPLPRGALQHPVGRRHAAWMPRLQEGRHKLRTTPASSRLMQYSIPRSTAGDDLRAPTTD
jgi:hypothetical protein